VGCPTQPISEYLYRRQVDTVKSEVETDWFLDWHCWASSLQAKMVYVAFPRDRLPDYNIWVGCPVSLDMDPAMSGSTFGNKRARPSSNPTTPDRPPFADVEESLQSET
jgi:hypothetical protein